MWYAAGEIAIFLLAALLLGGLAGFAIAQTYTISLTKSQEKSRASAKAAKELSAARAQITELQRLVATTGGDDASGARLAQRVKEANEEDGLADAEAV